MGRAAEQTKLKTQVCNVFYKCLGMCELQETWIKSDKQHGDILLIIDVMMISDV